MKITYRFATGESVEMVLSVCEDILCQPQYGAESECLSGYNRNTLDKRVVLRHYGG
jgi:hypothetical protein